MITWPIDILEPEKPDWQITGGVVAGGATIAGNSQTGIFGGGGLWSLTMGRIVINTRTQRLALRALQAQLDMGATPLIVAMPDHGGILDIADGPFTIKAKGAVALGATSMRIEVTSGPDILGGFVFSAADADGNPRRYDIGTSVVVSGHPTWFDVTFRPRMRAALADAAALDFFNPGCLMKLADPTSIYGGLTANRYGEISPIFIEYSGSPPS